MNRHKVLISACLLGRPVRYDGRGSEQIHPVLRRWREEDRLVVVCPEVAGALPVPRPPAEIQDGDGQDVLDGAARVVDVEGRDVSRHFVDGAQVALELARRHDVRIAIFKERSPSCANAEIYDGTFSKKLVAGVGVATALLQRHGIEVFGESELDEADARLREIERTS